MAMEERMWRKKGLERAAEICEKLAADCRHLAVTARENGDWHCYNSWCRQEEVLNCAIGRIRGEA